MNGIYFLGALILILSWKFHGTYSVVRHSRLKQLLDSADAQYFEKRRDALKQCVGQPLSGPRHQRGAYPLLGPSEGTPESRRGRRAASHPNKRRSRDKALSLSRNRLRYNGDRVRLPEHAFSVAFWCMAYGGQETVANILEAEDTCLPFADRGWTLGIHNPLTNGERDLRIYFSLHTWSRHRETNLTSPFPLVAERWHHITATYDGNVTALFINGAQVAVSRDQASRPPPVTSCRTLFIGGKENHHVRGRLDDLRLWNRALDRREVRVLVLQGDVPSPTPIVTEDFNDLDAWDTTDGDNQERAPQLVPSDVPDVRYQPLHLKQNPCGHTICDAPEVIESYRENWSLRKPKVLRYRVVNIANDDGSNPTVTNLQIRQQHEFLQSVFSAHNISWELEETLVRNTSLRRRWVLLSCDALMVGNGQCEPECRHPATGNDGGDCGRSFVDNYLHSEEHDHDPCASEMVDNEVCDPECNNAAHGWDGGDCCLDDNVASGDPCYDPGSPNRSYMDIREFKSFLKMQNTQHINVLFADWTNKYIVGIATFPWEKYVYNEQGGVVLKPSEYGVQGHMTSLVHELGHALGLLHVHYGVSELSCRHPCYESEASLVAGDMCADTPPIPENYECHEPSGPTVCGRSRFPGAPFTNYMGYGDESCVDEFTADQVARMHCYADLMYSSMQRTERDLPGPPLAPAVTESTSDSVTLGWTPPLATSAFYDTDLCSFCSEALELSQYGYEATASGNADSPHGRCTPDQATGPPDAELCTLSYKAWLPGMGGCVEDLCSLTVTFQHPVVASVLVLWINWNAHYGLKEVEIVFTDGTFSVITEIRAQCDSPLTIPLYYHKLMNKVHIRTASKFVSIDAVKVVSMPNSHLCSPCKPLRYKIHRNPPFQSGAVIFVEDNIFTDREIESEKSYTYQVQGWLGNRETDFSPPFKYIPNRAICGNGILEQSESCDDGGRFDGDGCNSRCEVENNFYCTADEPSICYWHEGDGICEDFELQSSISDCGFFTPTEAFDQWAITAEAGPTENLNLCQPTEIIGPPTGPLECYSDTNPSVAWTPCSWIDDRFWLKATFPEPVVASSVMLYLISDGSIGNHITSDGITTLELLDIHDAPFHSQELELSCSSVPLELKINWDLSIQLRRTASVRFNFTSSDVAIAAVKLRSSRSLRSVTASDCDIGHLYHPGLQKCDRYCPLPACEPPIVKHARLNCTGYQDGDVCTADCETGHRDMKAGTGQLHCMGSIWKGGDFNCKPLDCGAPIVAHADAVCPNGTTYGKRCTYKCRPPARFSGGGNGRESTTCEANGQWSEPTVQCQLMCPPPSLPAHTALASSKCRRANSFYFGQTCRFRCKSGYHVDGHSIRRRTLNLRCDMTASWSGPKCVPITCPMLYAMSYNCTVGNLTGSECVVRCTKTGPESMHRCELDGTWNPVLPEECSTAKTCSPPASDDLKLNFICDGNRIGAICKAMCQDEDEQPVATSVEEMHKIKCNETGNWYPDPKAFTCRKKCIQSYISDGYCDATNNQQHCIWDGGDCCPSTVEGKIVNRIPASCGQPCTCLDPNAVENHINS